MRIRYLSFPVIVTLPISKKGKEYKHKSSLCARRLRYVFGGGGLNSPHEWASKNAMTNNWKCPQQ